MKPSTKNKFIIFSRIFNTDKVKYIWYNSEEYNVLSIPEFLEFIKENFPTFTKYHILKDCFDSYKIVFLNSRNEIKILGDYFSIGPTDKEFLEQDPLYSDLFNSIRNYY